MRASDLECSFSLSERLPRNASPIANQLSCTASTTCRNHPALGRRPRRPREKALVLHSGLRAESRREAWVGGRTARRWEAQHEGGGSNGDQERNGGAGIGGVVAGIHSPRHGCRRLHLAQLTTAGSIFHQPLGIASLASSAPLAATKTTMSSPGHTTSTRRLDH